MSKNLGAFLAIGLAGGLALWLWQTSRGGDQQDASLDFFKGLMEALDRAGNQIIPNSARTKTNDGVTAAELAQIASFSGPMPIDIAGLAAVDLSNPVMGSLFPNASSVVMDGAGRGFVVTPTAYGTEAIVPTAALVDALGRGQTVTVAQPGGGAVTYTDHDASRAGALSRLSTAQVALVPQFVKTALAL